VIVDPEGDVRYAIYKKFDSEERRERQHAARAAPLRANWQKAGRQWKLQPEMLRPQHAAAR
jgi:hypothetical protein